MEFDFVIIGAGSAGCAVAKGLSDANVGTICVLEAGPTDAVPQVKVPFGLLYTMGSRRDWRFQSAAQASAGMRRMKVSRGRMIGGSSSINSMVWFRGRMDDYANWDLPGWDHVSVQDNFEEVEAAIQPQRLPDPHPISEAFGRTLGSNGLATPTPERESAGVFHTNMRHGRRWSAADAFLRPAQRSGNCEVLPGANVDRIAFEENRARTVVLTDGRKISARRGIVLSAGSIGSPAILMRSGVGPTGHLQEQGINVLCDARGVGQNLHDHPAVGVHHVGPNSGYGLTAKQMPAWMLSPIQWLLMRKGRMTSNFVEAGAFFRAAPVGPDGDDRPDVQTHFIPYMMGYRGKAITTGSGFFADVCVCRPVSRGRLTLSSKDPHDAPNIDLGVLSDPADLSVLVAGFKRLRTIIATAPFGDYQAPEAHPAEAVQTDDEIEDYVRNNCGTAYHPVGTLAMGVGSEPVAPDMKVKQVEGLWAADASVMPKITSANTNAPSMMIGHRAAKFICREIGRG
ncbi:GMC family oxidoreductase [Yoonia litorea]|uniref:Choline dehydrogenase n=1 Tax=Yoonia litorea TaxID=1123755 RepID=A0A1I6MZR6_9RHOB|nr:FAD-dependent oxidoreductase [Yoonia litorea]SFS21174.1 Choline dehydrogenase [Yoonia litorea]